MKPFIFTLLVTTLAFLSCKKKSSEPAAQITYSLVNKSVKASDPNPLGLDVNGDGKVDYSFFVVYAVISNSVDTYAGVNPILGNLAKTAPHDDDKYLNMGKVSSATTGIPVTSPNSAEIWNEDHAYLAIWHQPATGNEWFEGNWGSQTEHYMMLKLNINGSIHYGWLRGVFSRKNDQFTVIDYAWNQVPDQGIKVGEK